MVNVVKSATILLIISIIEACEPEKCGYMPEMDVPKVDIQIERLEDEVFQLKSTESVRDFADRRPIIVEHFLRKNEYPNDSIFEMEMARRFNNPYIDSLRMEVDKNFEDLSWLEDELSEAFGYLKHYYPEVTVPKIQTVATGFDFDMLVTDSLIVIGLDYYMGPEAKYRPMGTYNYILKRYDKKYIVPSIMLLYGISSGINKNDLADNTILADMISYGKSFYFAKRMMPCTPDSTLIWYSDEQMASIKKYDFIAWGYFLENGLLYETSHLLKRKYLDERPQTYEITQFNCPPRIATWLGWEIVKQYMEKHPGATLPELMNIGDARKIFEGSEYRPRKG